MLPWTNACPFNRLFMQKISIGGPRLFASSARKTASGTEETPPTALSCTAEPLREYSIKHSPPTMFPDVEGIRLGHPAAVFTQEGSQFAISDQSVDG